MKAAKDTPRKEQAIGEEEGEGKKKNQPQGSGSRDAVLPQAHVDKLDGSGEKFWIAWRGVFLHKREADQFLRHLKQVETRRKSCWSMRGEVR